MSNNSSDAPTLGAVILFYKRKPTLHEIVTGVKSAIGMKIGDMRLLIKIATTFFLVDLFLLAISFGSHYLGQFGFSFVPLAAWRANDLWWLLYSDACRAAGGAGVVAAGAYIAGKRIRAKIKTEKDLPTISPKA
ncbi:MAG TPA: hypothetical protein VGN23_13985 [Verrucomicrobiae bacterium]|jgi:hypothetical protein